MQSLEYPLDTLDYLLRITDKYSPFSGGVKCERSTINISAGGSNADIWSALSRMSLLGM